ncbi:MAG: AAA family ATPase [Acidimicrobiia bacterium]
MKTGDGSPLDLVEGRIVGLQRETEVLVTALRTGRHVVLEGPPGVGKSTLLRAVADAIGWGMEFVEGNAELTPARLVGSHDPAMVLERGYLPEAFTEGPLMTAMRSGAVLYVEELNRVPEETLNVLITALAEGEINVPRLGHVKADARFRLIAAMNPFDAVGTARVGQAIYDRMCRISLGYLDEVSERRIVERVTDLSSGGPAPGAAGDLIELAVALARATRGHEALRTGSSVRGAVDMVLLARGLADLRGEPTTDPLVETLRDGALAAFSGRVRVEEGGRETPEEVITQILERLLAERQRKKGSDPQAPPPEASPAGRGAESREGRQRPIEGPRAREAVREAGRRTASRSDLTAAHPQMTRISPDVGAFDEDAFDEMLARDAEEALALLSDLATATDPALRARARAAAARVFVRMARQGPRSKRGLRRLHTVPGTDGDLDLDRTLERTGGLRPRHGDDLVVRRWGAADRAVCLLVDRSGSMKGEAVAMAALACAAVVLAAEGRGDTSVVAFADRPIVLQSQGQRRAPANLIDEILSLRGRGTTDLAAALSAAAVQLGRATSADRTAVLMSDCLPTAGSDPIETFPGIDRLHVLGTSGEEASVAAGAALARRGGGRHLVVTSPTGVSAAMTALLA